MLFQAQYLMSAACTGDQRTRSFYIKGDLLRKKIKEPDLYSQLGGGSAHRCLKLPTAAFDKALPKQQLCICSRGPYTGTCQTHDKAHSGLECTSQPDLQSQRDPGEGARGPNPLELHGKCCMPMNISIFILFIFFWREGL